MTFRGIGEDAFDFYAGLEADNSKAYWTDHAETYRTAVKQPMEALLAELAPEFGAGSLFRPYRDVRFSKDKSPYKTHAGALLRKEGSTGGLYLQVGADGMLAAAGYYQMASDQLERFRRAVDDDIAGAALERLLGALTKKGLDTRGEQVRTRPRGWAADHPRIELIRRKGLYAGREWEPAEWMHTPACATEVATAFRTLAPLQDWLAANVGASTAEPPRRR
jgi:uncharacterized protein (TIGR02453 family)